MRPAPETADLIQPRKADLRLAKPKAKSPKLSRSESFDEQAELGQRGCAVIEPCFFNDLSALEPQYRDFCEMHLSAGRHWQGAYQKITECRTCMCPTVQSHGLRRLTEAPFPRNLDLETTRENRP